jgi:CRP-like cAMP-binding protein
MRSLDQMLADCLWMQELTPEQQTRVRETVTVSDYDAGAVICHKGNPANMWLGVVDGLIKINTDSRDGKSVTFAGVSADGWFGEGSVLKKELRRYDVVALRQSRIAFMPERTFHWLLDHSFGFNRFLLLQLNERLSQFIGTLECDRLQSTDTKVARSLSSLFNPQLYPSTGRKIQISQEELGFLAGASRQRVNKALHLLEAQGLVSVDYGSIEVLELEGLREFEG